MENYPLETAWAPAWVGDQLRQARADARTAHHASIRCAAEASLARNQADHTRAAEQQALADSYEAMCTAYEQRVSVLAVKMADRADWEQATRHQRQLAVAADAEVRRRHPDQPWPPLSSAEPEPEPASPALVGDPTEADLEVLTPDIQELLARRHEVISRLAERYSQMIPAEDPDAEAYEPAFPLLPRRVRGAIPQPPPLEMLPPPSILQRTAWRDADWEAGA